MPDLILPQFPVDLSNPVNWEHPLNLSRLAWYLGLPNLSSGKTWYNLVSGANGTLTSMAAGTGWADTVRPGGFAAMHFSGSAGHIPLGSDPSYNVPGALTVAAWVRTTTIASGGASIFQAYDTNSPFHGFALGANGAVVNSHKFSWWNGTAWTDSTTSINDGLWHRVLIATTGTTINFYLDGKLDKTTTTASPSLSFSGTRTIGALNGGGSGWWNGDLDDLTLWGRFFSAADALDDYTLSSQGYPGVISRYAPILALEFQNAPATALTLLGPTPASGYAGASSNNWAVGSNGAVTGTVVVTPSDSGAGGTFTPSTVSLTGTSSTTFTYKPGLTRNASVTVTLTNVVGLTNPAGVAYGVSRPTIALTPSALRTALAGQSVIVTGTGSLWNTNTPTFTLTGLSGSSVTSQVVNSDTQTTLTVTTGSTQGVGTITETSQGETASLSILPTTTWSSPANFGTSNTGLTGTVGFAVVNPDGSVFTARTTSGVTEYPSGSGIYWPGTLTFVIGFRGGIIWDTGGTTPKYAVDALNLGSNDTNGRTQIQPGTAVGQISLTDGAVDVISFNGNLTVGGKNWYNTFRYISATTAGLLPSGAGSNTESWQDFGGAAAVSFTVDAHGNRTGAVYS